MKILFLCTHNSARSQIAEGMARELDRKGRHQFFSAGTEPGAVHPKAVSIMRERAIDISRHRSKALSEVPEQMDLVITLCSDAEEKCPLFPGNPRRLHWPLPDPSKFQGTEQELRGKWAGVRDDIERRLSKLLDELG